MKKQVIPNALWWDEAVRDRLMLSVASVLRGAAFGGNWNEALKALAEAVERQPRETEFWRAFVKTAIPYIKEDAKRDLETLAKLKQKIAPTPVNDYVPPKTPHDEVVAAQRKLNAKRGKKR